MPRVYVFVLYWKIVSKYQASYISVISWPFPSAFFKLIWDPRANEGSLFLQMCACWHIFVSMQDLHSPNRSLPLTLVGKTRIKSPFGANTLQVVHKKKDSRNFRYYMRVSIRYFPSLVYERIKGRNVIVFNSCIFICLCKQMKGLCSSTKECIPRYIQCKFGQQSFFKIMW